ncbi:proline-, glutamic acid- and leucine-rich protein 1 [Culex quinquefasciatus]|uniref:proline-, glutamic acid- and leucine-rich protein 1 n=1 Tax=Culex quinquefasciatus TaxID=7176 RepID=UPI0018E2B297|nr:proline-, glutamic acid- and leucine-rich protein 1 [Culex quinquefasciatus]
MEGVSKIFGGFVDMKEGNFRHLLVALDEHQTLWTEPQHEIESHFAKVGSLLGSALTRDRGLTALAHLIPQCPLEILEGKLQYYINVCAKVCNQRGHVATVPLAYDVLKQLLLKSLESSDLNKLIISNIPKLLDNVTSNADSSTRAATLDFLEMAMRHYPGVTGSAKNRIEDYLYSLVDSDDASVVHRTGTCLLLLQQIRGGGQHGTLHKKTWDEYQCKLVDSIHELLGRVFEHTPETFDVDENLECLKLPALVVEDEPVDAARRIVTRLLNLICYLEKAVVGAYPVAKPFRPMKLLNVVLRGHSVSCQMMAKNSILENVALGMFLPQIQAQLLKLLDGMVLVLKSYLFPFRNLLTDLFDQCLKGTVTVDGKGRKKSYISLRTKVYGSIAVWCETVKFGSGVEEISDSLLENIVQDVAPYEPEVTLQVNASRQKLSAKAKKKLQKEQNAATALAKNHTSGSLEISKHLQSDYCNEVLCLAALRCLAKVLDAAGCFIKPVMQKLLQEKIVSLCVSVFSQLNTGAKQNLYFEPNCRQALLVALNSLIINPHHLCPPPLQYGVTMFSAAESQDPNVDVRSKAAELARGAETLLHPRKEVFYFPLEENAVKDMLAAKKKHPLNAVFFQEKEKRSMPITFEKVKSQECSEMQSESDDSPKEDEPIARVEEITIEEDQPSAVVYDLGDDETEADFNRGELQKSTAEKTVESAAIVLDSEEDNEVELVETEQTNESKRVETPKKAPEEPKTAAEEPSVEILGTPKKPMQSIAQKRKPEAEEKSQHSEEVDGKRAKIAEGDDDILARVDDLVAEFVDELNEDV